MVDFETIKTALMNGLTANQFFTGGAMLGAIGIGFRYAQGIPAKLWSLFRRQMFYTIQLDSSDPSFYALLECLKEFDLDQHFRNNELKYQWKWNHLTNESASHVKLRPVSDWRFGKVFGEWCIVSISKIELKSSNSNKEQSVNIKGVRYDVHPDGFINKYTLTFFTPWSFRKVRDKFNSLYDYFPENEKDKNRYTTVYRMSGNGYWNETDIKSRKLESVFLPKSTKDRLLKFFEDFYSSESWYEDRGIPYRRGLLLHGKPGNGKSSIVSAIAAHLKKDLYYLNVGSVKSDEQLLSYMQTETPGIILMEDIDCVTSAAKRDEEDKDDDSYNGVTLSGLLNAIDGVLGQDGSIVVMTTNHPQKLDPALVRPGRVDLSVSIGNASTEQLTEAYSRFFPDHVDKAIVFAENVGHEKWPMCAIQNHLVIHSEDPEAAALGKIDEHSNREFQDFRRQPALRKNLRDSARRLAVLRSRQVVPKRNG